MIAPSPVALFAYARPDHLQRTVASLLRNPEASATALHVYCDGARTSEHEAAVRAVRRVVDSLEGFASIRRVYRERNLGLANSVIDGVGEVLLHTGRVIVVEDDLLLSPHFLRFMNEGLALYADDAEVASIHGYSYPTDKPLPETFFLQGADCWGWATWARAWRHFEPDGRRLLGELARRRLIHDFDFDGSFLYSRMLADQADGRNDSWAIRWHAACYLAGMLTLYPGRSLVHNTGNDASGTHGENSGAFERIPAEQPIQLQRQPLASSAAGREAFVSFFRRQRSLAARLRRWLRHPPMRSV